jgi:hypothetical protein
MRPFLSQFEIDIPPEQKSAHQITYDAGRMILMIAERPAAEQPELLREPTTRKTLVGQETTDDN